MTGSVQSGEEAFFFRPGGQGSGTTNLKWKKELETPEPPEKDQNSNEEKNASIGSPFLTRRHAGNLKLIDESLADVHAKRLLSLGSEGSSEYNLKITKIPRKIPGVGLHSLEIQGSRKSQDS